MVSDSTYLVFGGMYCFRIVRIGFSVVCSVIRIVLIWFSGSTYWVFGGMYCFSHSA